MDLYSQLARHMMQTHPDEAAWALEPLEGSAVAAALAAADPAEAAAVLRRISRYALGNVLPQLEPRALAAIAEHLDLEVAAHTLRRLSAEARDAVCAELGTAQARSIRALLRHAEETAGALMDPDILALPSRLTVKEAIDRVREHPEAVRYNVYVTSEENLLVGVLNLRELLLGRPQATLESIMNPATHRLLARADRRQIVQHPGWRDVHALPVVDERGVFLGAVRYRMLRRLEHELRGAGDPRSTTALALGDLFATGASGLLSSFAEAARPERGIRNGE
jgi:magnesium transporter